MTTLSNNADQIDLNTPGLGPDTIFAEAGADFVRTSTLGGSLIFGQADNDTLISVISVGPNDTLHGGADEDSLRSQGTPAWLYGEAGNDTIVAQGRATMEGGEGDDFMQATAEANQMLGNEGNDTMLGGAVGRDSIYGGKDNDSLGFFTASGGNNLGLNLTGGSGGNQGSNYLLSGSGNDLVVGINIRDSLFGGKGNDTLVGVASNSYLSGDNGNDRLSVTNSTQTSLFASDTVIVGIEKVTLLGGLGDDSLTGAIGNFNAGKSFFNGGDGNDTITVFATQDTALGGAGNDFIKSQTTNVLLSTGAQSSLAGFAGKSSLDGEVGNDTIVGGYASDTLMGGDDTVPGIGNDSLSGLFSLASGGQGNDTINASGNFGTTPASITLEGGLGDDSLVGNFNTGTVTNFMNGGAGNDTIIFGSTGDQLISNGDFAGNDFISCSSVDFTSRTTTNIITDTLGNNFLDGGNGSDVFTTGDGIDVLFGRDGNDTLNGGGGNDTLFGDIGNDYLIGGDGNDSLGGAAGADTLIGGAGSDSFYYNNSGEGATVTATIGSTDFGTQPDQISDFVSGQDKLIFQSSQFGFATVSVPSGLPSQSFLRVDAGDYNATTPAPTGTSPLIVYEAANGRLLYDADGQGGKDAIYLALLNGKPRLNADDITLI